MHLCRWPGCEEEVDDRLWGCSRHWAALPPEIRRAIWAAYKPGQGVEFEPSAEWDAADRWARDWAHDHPLKAPAQPTLF